MIFLAVKKDGLAFICIDESLKYDEQIVYEALRNDGRVLYLLPEKLFKDPKVRQVAYTAQKPKDELLPFDIFEYY